ncbi:hypothetical protein HMI54_010626, partial [Coelomomyces lativittatus]
MRFQLWVFFFIFTFISILERDVNAILGSGNTKATSNLKDATKLSEPEKPYFFKPKYNYIYFVIEIPERLMDFMNSNLQATQNFEETTEENLIDFEDSNDSPEPSTIETCPKALSDLFKETIHKWKEGIENINSNILWEIPNEENETNDSTGTNIATFSYLEMTKTYEEYLKVHFDLVNNWEVFFDNLTKKIEQDDLASIPSFFSDLSWLKISVLKKIIIFEVHYLSLRETFILNFLSYLEKKMIDFNSYNQWIKSLSRIDEEVNKYFFMVMEDYKKKKFELEYIAPYDLAESPKFRVHMSLAPNGDQFFCP